MNKRYGFCDAGCKREVVGREEYDQAIGGLAYELDQVRKALADMENKLNYWKPVGTDVYADMGNTYRIVEAEGDIGWGATIEVYYTVNNNNYSQTIELPEYKYKDYFDIEFVDFYTDHQDGMGILVYKIDGVEKRFEWDHDGAKIDLLNVYIEASSEIYKYSFIESIRN